MTVTVQRDELRRLVEEIPDEAVDAALAEVRGHLPRPVDRPWPPAWFGAATASRSDTAARAEELLAEGFGHRA